MKIKLVSFATMLICGAYAEETPTLTENKKVALQDAQSIPWDWFITHIALNNKMKNLDALVSKCEPVVRFYDRDSGNIIVELQRLTLEGENTTLQDEGITLERFITTIPSQPDYRQDLINVLYHGRKIMSVALDGQNNKIVAYDKDGKENPVAQNMPYPDAYLKATKIMLRLSPRKTFIPLKKDDNLEDFFKQLREEFAQKNK